MCIASCPHCWGFASLFRFRNLLACVMYGIWLFWAPSRYFYQREWIAFPISKGLAQRLSSSQFSAGFQVSWLSFWIDKLLYRWNLGLIGWKIHPHTRNEIRVLFPPMWWEILWILKSRCKYIHADSLCALPAGVSWRDAPWLGWVHCAGDSEQEVRHSSEVRGSQPASCPSSQCAVW